MWDHQGPISTGYLAHYLHTFFMSIHIEFSASYSMLSQSLVTLTFLTRLFINSEFLSSEAFVPITAFLIPATGLNACAASACNWASYRSLNVMVLICTQYIKCFTKWMYHSIPVVIRTWFAGLANRLSILRAKRPAYD